jgi:uncharacterized protein YbjT (DUF2867 family)
MILVVGATGMFGGQVAHELLRQGRPVRALVRDEAKGQALREAGAELAVADLDRPETLAGAVRGVETVFLVSPMDGRIADREIAVTEAASVANVQRVVKLHGAVRHDGDALDRLHQASIARLRESGLSWVLVSPNSVIETTLYSQRQALQQAGAMLGSARDSRVALVAAADVGRAAAAVITRDRVSTGEDFVITGPEAVTMNEVATMMSDVLDRRVVYQDLSDEEFTAILSESGLSAEQIEIGIIAHFRAWRTGGADIVTDTYRKLIGHAPMSVRQWLEQHRSAFD